MLVLLFLWCYRFSVNKDLYMCLETFNCLQAEQTIALRKRKFLNKFSVTHCIRYSLPMLRQNLNHVARTFS